MKNLIISVLLTKVLADNVLVPCTASELAGMVIAVFTIATLIDMRRDKLRQHIATSQKNLKGGE